MPKIKVYKAQGAIIPVDDAKVATGFRCPWTKKVFSTKKTYVQHLRNLREDRIHRVIRARIRNKIFEDLINQPDFQNIINWIETHPEFVFDGIVQSGRAGWRDRREHLREKFWLKITYLDVQYSDNVSNSHNCPRDGVTNWRREEGKPTGYPGYSGRIEFQLSHDLGFGSDVMKPLGIYTGTGGGINENRYGYDVRFFLSDWPGLDKYRLFDIIKNPNARRAFRIGEPRYFNFRH